MILRFGYRTLALLAITVFLASCAGSGSLPSSTARSAQSNAGGAQQTTLSYVSVPAPYSITFALLVGPDGALWFGEWNTNADGNIGAGQAGIGRLATDGTVAETPLATGVTPIPGTFDAGGNLWFSDGGGYFDLNNATTGSFNVLSPNGNVASYPVAYRGRNPRPRFSVATPDGNIWFTLLRANEIARVAPDGTFATFAVPPTSEGRAWPHDIVFGPDGALWFTELSGNAIGRMTLDGTLTNVYPLPTARAAPRFLAVGHDGAFWVALSGSEFYSGDVNDHTTPPQIVRMTTSGQITSFAMPPNAAPLSIRAASGGFVFSDYGTNALGFIDYSGNVVEYPIAYDGGASGNVAFAVQGFDGAFYFSDAEFNRIGKLTLDKKGLIFPQTIAFPAPSRWGGTTNTQLVGVAVSGDRGQFSASIDNPNVATVTPLAGFPMNFTVTATGIGTATLTIKGKGKPMTASVTVRSLTTTTQSLRSNRTRPMHELSP